MKSIIVGVLLLALFVGLFGVGPFLDEHDKAKETNELAEKCGNGSYVLDSKTGEISCLFRRGSRKVKEVRK